VFVRPTNSLVVHSQLLRRVFNHAHSHLLTEQQKVYIVADVGFDVGLPTLEGLLIPPSSGCVKVTVYGGAKPFFSPISCVVIAIQQLAHP